MNAEAVATRSAASGKEGVVAAHNPEATMIGRRVMRDGGTAIDAAIAMSAATAVRETAMTGLGGVGVLLVHSAATERTSEVTFYGRTPEALAEDTFLPLLESEDGPRGTFGFRGVRDSLNERGFLSVGVPGYVAGIGALHEGWGSVPWGDLLAPAAALARSGFGVDEEDVYFLATVEEHLRRFPEVTRIFLGPDRLLPHDLTWRQGDLASTIERIAAAGYREFYDGEVGQSIARHVEENGGALRRADLRKMSADVGDGLRGMYHGYEVVTSSGPNGGVTLLEMLNLAEQLGLRELKHNSAQYLHLVIEIMRRAWTDRMVHLSGEGAAVGGLVSREYAESIASRISTHTVPTEVSAEDPWPYSDVPRPAGLNQAPRGESHQTTHVLAADRYGNVATITQTLGHCYGSGIVPPGTGVTLNDLVYWFNPEPGTLNSVGGWRRPLGHATPTILLQGSRPILALGAPGSRKIVTAIFQIIMNVVDHGMGIQEAIEAPRIHSEGADPARPEGLPMRTVTLDHRIERSLVEDLLSRGHHAVMGRDSSTRYLFARPLGVQLDQTSLHAGVAAHGKSTALAF